MKQAEIFLPPLPPGLIYREDFITPDEEQALQSQIRELPLKEAQYRQYTARRRTVNFGFAYDFTHLESKPAPPIAEFLTSLRTRAAEWLGVQPEDFVQASIAEYRPGTPLGWQHHVPPTKELRYSITFRTATDKIQASRRLKVPST